MGQSEGKGPTLRDLSVSFRGATKTVGASLSTVIGSPTCTALLVFNIVLKYELIAGTFVSLCSKYSKYRVHHVAHHLGGYST